jgi:hypothetical protein
VFGVGLRGLYCRLAFVSRGIENCGGGGSTLYDLNMVTSPKRSITRRTSRRSAKVRAEGCSLRKTVRAEREEAIVVGIIEESWLVIGREESDEVEVAMENYTAVGLCRKRARLNLVTKNKGRRGGRFANA